MAKYSFTKCNDEGEIFKVEGCDSWDEAIRQVEKGISSRDAVLAERAAEELPASPTNAPAVKSETIIPQSTSAPKVVAPAKPDMIQKLDADGNVIK